MVHQPDVSGTSGVYPERGYMADTETIMRSITPKAAERSEPVPIGAILPDLCATIEARRQKAMARLCLRQRRTPPAEPIRLAG
jgi:hypothetical protein